MKRARAGSLRQTAAAPVVALARRECGAAVGAERRAETESMALSR
jgi:hypothetical protein